VFVVGVQQLSTGAANGLTGDLVSVRAGVLSGLAAVLHDPRVLSQRSKYRGAASKDELFRDHVPLLGSILPSGVFGAT